MAGIQTGLTDAQLLASQLKAHELVGQDLATQADLDALALSTGNLTASQVTTIDNLSGLTSNASAIDDSVLITSSTIKEDVATAIFNFVDNEDKILMSISNDGYIYDASGKKIVKETINVQTSDYVMNNVPYEFGKTVTIAEVDDQGQIFFEIDIFGYINTTTGLRDTKTIINNSLTHPKILFIKNGWNGYSYWMAATPYFGSAYGTPSENPHILCSNDGINWTQLLDEPIDMVDSSPSHFADTHLILGSDNFLYCLYKGTQIDGDLTGDKIFYKKTADGVNWTDRQYLTSSIGSVCPVIIHGANGGFDYFDRTSERIRKRWTNEISVIPDDSQGTFLNITNEIWLLKDAEQDIWHFDIDRIGNLWLGLAQVQGGTSSKDVYLMYSGDGWNWTVIDYIFGNGDSYYRSCIVPVSFTEDSVTIDIYLASTNGGIINKLKTTLEII